MIIRICLLSEILCRCKSLLPLKLGKYFKRYKDVNEMDWYDEIKVNKNLKLRFFLRSTGQRSLQTQTKLYGVTF